MTVREGGFYKTRIGNIVGPLALTPLSYRLYDIYIFCLKEFPNSPTWTVEGEIVKGSVYNDDLIEEHFPEIPKPKLICDVTLDDLRRGIAKMHPNW